MITRLTVLILGAGASIPYEFPSGRKLMSYICNSLMNPPTKFSYKLNECGFKNTDLAQFGKELLHSMQPSVDLFLEKRPEYMAIGKTAIACALIPFEQRSKIQRSFEEMEWYEYLFHRLDASKKDFPENKLSILTYNYDRSLEYFLIHALEHTYGIDIKKASYLLRDSIPIIHLYGQLGELPHLGKNTRDYKDKSTKEEIELCASQIKIISEATLDLNLQVKITKILEDAVITCFLGCGYHKANIELIFTKIWENQNFKFKNFYGSCFGLGDGEKALVRSILKTSRLELGNEDMDCLNFLRNYPILI